jgi:hypothetical protein
MHVTFGNMRRKYACYLWEHAPEIRKFLLGTRKKRMLPLGTCAGNTQVSFGNTRQKKTHVTFGNMRQQIISSGTVELLVLGTVGTN